MIKGNFNITQSILYKNTMSFTNSDATGHNCLTVAIFGLEIYQMNVKIIFLNSELDDEICMK